MTPIEDPTPPVVWLDALPATPAGWTKKMRLHLSFGGAGGLGVYQVFDDRGRQVEGVEWGYDSRTGGGQGFILSRGRGGYLTWEQARAAYQPLAPELVPALRPVDAPPPTLEVLRAQLPVVGGKRRGLYAGAPGSGPEGKTCRSCRHKTYTGNTKLHPKCALTQYTHGDATTIRTSTPACKHYEEGSR